MNQPALHFKDGIFYLKVSFNERMLAKGAGFRWNINHKIWYTPDVSVAARLRDYAIDEAKNQINAKLIHVAPWSRPLPIIPEGLSLLEHQPVAINFSLSRNRSYLGLDPGLGKTIIAALIAASLNKKCVYVCPPFLVQNTIAEFRKWAPKLLASPFEEAPALTADVTVVPDSMLINKDVLGILSRFGKLFGDAVLFVDEAHRFKNEGSQRTTAMFGENPRGKPRVRGIVDNIPTQIFMSGTPMPNRPMELYSVLSNAAPETIDFMNKHHFGVKYCAAFENQFGWDYTGASNLPELRRRVIAPTGPFMLRMKKELLNLPPKLEEVFVVSEDMSPCLAQMNRGIGERYSKVEDVIKARIAAAHDKNSDDLHVATYRRLLGEEKVDAAVEYIKNILEETDESILVFAFHKDVISRLNYELSKFKPIVITGQTPVSQRQELVNIFQQSKTHRILIGNYIAAGVGFTLTKATRVLFVEFDWVPGVNDQAGDRAHRIGQKSPVLVQYMVYKDSIDKAVIEVLLRKRKSTDYI